MKKLLLLTLCFSLSVFAQLENNTVFRKQGGKVVTKFSGSNYVATRDLLYYIPDSVDLSKPTTIVVYLHGGNSNMLQSNSTETADTLFWGTANGIFSKKSGIRPIAHDQKFIVVMPTTTTGWNDFTPFYMKDLLAVIRKELNPDPNKVFLLGHSMGAMGICRAAASLADEFAMFLPMSGGFQPHLKTLSSAGPFFNTHVWTTTGAKYDFPTFRIWNEDFENFLNSKYVQDFFHASKPLDWDYEIHPLTHNPNIDVLTQRLGTYLPSISRDLYQSELFGGVYKATSSETYIRKYEIMKYFWFEALSFRPLEGNETSIGMNFRLYTKNNNEVDLYIDRPINFIYDTRPHLQKVRLHLSEKLFNLNEPITVNLYTKRGTYEQKTVLYKGQVTRDDSAAKAIRTTSGDKGFVFESFLDLTLPQN